MQKTLVIFLLLCFAFVGLTEAQKSKKSQKTKTTKQQTSKTEDNKTVYGPPPKPKNEITPEEEKEAKAFAELFIKRMRETRDLKPLIDEMFFSGFKSPSSSNEFWWATVGLPTETVDYLSIDEKVELYCNKVTIDYISLLYMYSKISEEQLGKIEDTDKNNENLFPTALLAYGKTIKQPDENISKRDLILLAMKYSKEVLKLWQEEVINNPPENATQFKANLETFYKHLEDKNNDWGKPRGTILDKERYHLPVGTKVINLEIPFHIGLVMAKENGRMKMLYIYSRVLPD